jgi:hypothetical protein
MTQCIIQNQKKLKDFFAYHTMKKTSQSHAKKLKNESDIFFNSITFAFQI